MTEQPPLRLRAIECGRMQGDLGLFLEGETGRFSFPVLAFLVEHPRGTLLFDAGLHPDVADDPAARIGAPARLFGFDFSVGDDVASKLAACGVEPATVTHVVNSHLHFDHAGGNALLPNARLLVQRREWEAGHDADAVAQNAFNPADYDHGHDVVLVDGGHDVFGDGSVVCVPTFGHTPGHQSLKVRTAGGDVVLTADACYLRRTLEDMHLPRAVADRDAMLASLGTLAALQARGARLVFGHDPELWSRLPAAPRELTAKDIH